MQEAERAKAAASLSAARQQAHGGARFNERIRTFHYVVRSGGWSHGRRACKPGGGSARAPRRDHPTGPLLAPHARQDGRVTDHRVAGAVIQGGVERVLSGDCLHELMDAVAGARREEALAAVLAEQQAAGGRSTG